MKKISAAGNLVLISVILLTAQSIAAPAWGDTAAAAYKEQMRAYHAKLLAYQVQPGRLQEQRKQTCDSLKELTRNDQNVDALWTKFDALERKARGADTAYADECKALMAEVKTKSQQFSQGQRDDSNKKETDKAAADRAQSNAARQAAIASMMKEHSTPSGVYFNRRKRIWDELKRCYAQKKGIDNHVSQYEAMLGVLSGGKGDLNDLLTKLEDSLAIPHNLKD